MIHVTVNLLKCSGVRWSQLGVECHPGLVHFKFLAFGHSGAQGLSARVPTCQKLKNIC